MRYNLDVSGWDTSSVTNMNNMFRNTSITSLDLSRWNTRAVTTMTDMFRDMSRLTSLTLDPDFVTVGNPRIPAFATR